MGAVGAEAIRDYVRGGGRYLGTCAGMSILLNETNRVALLPLRRIDRHFTRGGGDLGVEFSEAGAKLLGLGYPGGPKIDRIAKEKAAVVAATAKE